MQRFLIPVLSVLAFLATSGSGAHASDGLVDGVPSRSVKTEIITLDDVKPEQPEVDREIAESDKASGAFAKRIFTREVTKERKSYACFVREYDSAHLAQHPLQKVGAMRLLVTAEIVPEDEKLNYAFRLGVKFRNKPHEFSSAGECGHAQASEDNEGKEQLGCGVDCDGGGLSVQLHEDNKSALVKAETIRIWRGDRETDGNRLEAGQDDKSFRLSRAPIEQCKSLAYDRKELAAMRRK
jgi:hypothetical protein